MTALLLPAILLAVIVLPGLLRCTVRAAFRQGLFSLELYLLGFRLPLPKKRKRGNNPPETRASLKRKQGPDIFRFARQAELALKLFVRFFEKMRVDRLKLHVLAAFPDPYDTAMAYNLAGLSMQTVMQIAGDGIKELDLRNDLDFYGEKPVLDVALHASLRMGRLLAIVLAWLYGHRKILRACRKG